MIYAQLLSDKNPGDPNGWTPLHVAAGVGHFEICKLIIDNIENKNPKSNIGGRTPFHCAAENGDPRICQYIIDNIGGE